MRIVSFLILLIVNVILALLVSLILTCENERNNFELFIESINNNPVRVYAVTKGPDLRQIVARHELDIEEKEEFIRFLSSSKEIPTPSAGIRRDSYDFQIHERVGESDTRIWKIDVIIEKETRIGQFWISGKLSWTYLHCSQLDEQLSEAIRNYLASLGLEG